MPQQQFTGKVTHLVQSIACFKYHNDLANISYYKNSIGLQNNNLNTVFQLFIFMFYFLWLLASTYKSYCLWLTHINHCVCVWKTFEFRRFGWWNRNVSYRCGFHWVGKTKRWAESTIDITYNAIIMVYMKAVCTPATFLKMNIQPLRGCKMHQYQRL